MKKWMLIILSMVFLMGLSGCGGSNNNADDKSIDYSQYNGVWAETDLSWEYGGSIMDIYVEDSQMTLMYTLVGSAPASRMAMIEKVIQLSDIKDGEVSFEFDDDSWGVAGNMEIEFLDDTVEVEIYNTHFDTPPIWGVSDGKFVLERNDAAYEMIVYSEEEYYEKYSDQNMSGSNEAYNPSIVSTSSGILAELGMTESDFRGSCTYLMKDGYMEIDGYVALSVEEIKAYPNNFMGKHFVTGKNGLLNSGWNIAPNSLAVKEKGTTAEGYYYYGLQIDGNGYYTKNNQIVIIDMRDDVYSPNITEGDIITPYMIFIGLQNDVPVFKMISVDVNY